MSCSFLLLLLLSVTLPTRPVMTSPHQLVTPDLRSSRLLSSVHGGSPFWNQWRSSKDKINALLALATKLARAATRERSLPDNSDDPEISGYPDIVPEEEYNPSVEKLQQDRAFCHYRALHKCGQAVVLGFKRPNLDYHSRCDLRENFLSCMIREKELPCRPRKNTFREAALVAMKEQLAHILWTARGCVIGLDTSGSSQ